MKNKLLKNIVFITVSVLVVTSCGGGESTPAPAGGSNPTSTQGKPGSVQFEPAQYSFAETAGKQLLLVSRTGGSKGVAIYKVTITGGSATQGQDFTIALGNVSWADGEQGNKTISTTIINNAVVNEGTENFIVTLSLVSGETTLVQNTATVTITDVSSSGGVVQFSAPKFTALEDSGNRGAVVTVSRLRGSSGSVSVDFSTSDGTAVSGVDYISNNGTLTWADGTSGAKNIFITVLTDGDTNEGDETIGLTLSSANGASLGSIANTTLTVYDVAGPANLSTQESYLFYETQDYTDSNGLTKSIYAVNPGNPNVPEFVTGNNFAFSSRILQYKYHITGGTVNQQHTYAVIYVDNTGILMRATGLTANGPINFTNTKQISNEAGITDGCEMRMPGYTADREKQIIFFSTGMFCDVWKYVELGRSNALPATLAKEPVTELQNTNGVPTGYLAIDTDTGSRNLMKCNLDFTVCQNPIVSNIFTVNEINSATNGDLLLEIDDKLYWYNDMTGLSNVIHTPSPQNFFNFYYNSDESNQYFVDGSTIYKLKLDGVSSPEILIVEKDVTQLSLQYFTAGTFDNLIYSITNSANNSELRLLAKDGSDNGTPTILTTTSNANYFVFGVRNSRIYYNVYPIDVSLNVNSGMIMEDGSSKQEMNNSYWAGGFSKGTIHPSDILTDTIIRVVDTRDVYVYNIASNVRGINLGKVEVARSTFNIGGSNRYGIGSSFDPATQLFPISEGDVYFSDVETAGSLLRLTNTTTIHETPIF
ncbi:MAG: Calx-beta domain-containing protein [Gammaproteobacteria bacterium]